MHDRAISLAASLHIVRVHTRCRPGGVAALVRLLSAVKVDVLEVKGVQVARDVSEKGQADVDKQVYARKKSRVSEGSSKRRATLGASW